MLVLIAKVTVLFTAGWIALVATQRSSAAIRHLMCFCVLAGSLILPVAALLPARVPGIRLYAIDVMLTSHAVTRAANWSPSAVIFGCWALGSAILLLRLATGYRRIATLMRRAAPIEPGLYFADVNVPIVSGLFRPAVFMPRSAAEWPEWQRNAAVRHELTHVKRKDLWANFVAHLACAVYWFHPLAWALAWRMRHEEEAACDDAVLESGFEPATYAEALLAVARNSNTTLLPGCPMTTQTNLKTRITRLLDNGIARTTSPATLHRTAVICGALLLTIVALSPARADPVYKTGGDVVSPQVIQKVAPEYTEEAKRDKIQGTVVLTLVVGTDGLAHDVAVERGIDAGLDRNAAEILQQWRFAPGTLKGEPVAVQATIEINYRLEP
jgi:TonB family protein